MIDVGAFGRRIKAARAIAGFDRMADLVIDIKQVCDFDVSERTMYAIERGERLPSLELHMCLLIVLRPPGGAQFFMDALPHALRDKYVDAAQGR